MTSSRALAILYLSAGLLDELRQHADLPDADPLVARAARLLRDLDAADPGWRDRTPRGADAARGRGAGGRELRSPWAVIDTTTGRIVGRWRTRELAEARLRPGQAVRGPEVTSRRVALLPPRLSERGTRIQTPGARSLPLSDDELRTLRDLIDRHLGLVAPDTAARLRHVPPTSPLRPEHECPSCGRVPTQDELDGGVCPGCRP